MQGSHIDFNSGQFELLFNNTLLHETDNCSTRTYLHTEDDSLNPVDVLRVPSLEALAQQPVLQIAAKLEPIDTPQGQQPINLCAASHLTHSKLQDPNHQDQVEKKGRRWRSGNAQLRAQLTQLEGHLEKLTAQFKQLSTANTTLKQRLQLLETLLPLRDQQASLVSRNSSSLPLLAPRTTADMNNFPSASPAEPDSSAASIAFPSAAGTACSHNAATATHPAGFGNVLLPKAASLAPTMQHNLLLQPLHASLPLPPVLTLGQLIQRVFPLSNLPAVSMTDEEYRHLWLEFQKSTGFLVASWEAYPTAHVLRQLEDRVLDVIRKTVVGVAVLDPDIMFRNLYINLETGQQDFPGEQFWQAVVRTVQFTPEQVHLIKNALASWEAKMGALLTERQALAHTLAAHIIETSTSIPSKINLAADHKLDELAAKMKGSLTAERKMHYNLIDSLGLSVFTVTQCAKLIVSCYPYAPDSIAVLRAVVRQADAEPVC